MKLEKEGLFLIDNLSNLIIKQKTQKTKDNRL